MGLFAPYVQSIAQKKAYMSRASAPRGFAPLDIAFFCTLALIRGKKPLPELSRSGFFQCDILTSV